MEQLLNADLSLLIRLILAHFLADFLFQKSSWVKERISIKWKSKSLYLHILIVGVLTWLFSGHFQNFWIPIFVMVTHYLTDIWKSYSKNNIAQFLIDQAIHIIIILIAWLFYAKVTFEDFTILWEQINTARVLAIITGYYFVVWPAGFIIAKITENWQSQISKEGLAEAGKWIGIFERFLILTFVLINQFAGIGFLIAAKSILRFGEIKNKDQRKDAEYILLGTMISFILAILTGLLINSINLSST
jgi:hypothetical protein